MDHLDFVKLLLANGARVNTRICGVESSAKECKGDTTETRTNFTPQWLSQEGVASKILNFVARALMRAAPTLMSTLVAGNQIGH